jgi:hypothetical protein
MKVYSSFPKVSFRGKCVHKGHLLKLPSPTKLARLGHFPPASRAGYLAGPVFYTIAVLLSYDRQQHTVYDLEPRNAKKMIELCVHVTAAAGTEGIAF